MVGAIRLPRIALEKKEVFKRPIGGARGGWIKCEDTRG